MGTHARRGFDAPQRTPAAFLLHSPRASRPLKHAPSSDIAPPHRDPNAPGPPPVGDGTRGFEALSDGREARSFWGTETPTIRHWMASSPCTATNPRAGRLALVQRSPLHPRADLRTGRACRCSVLARFGATCMDICTFPVARASEAQARSGVVVTRFRGIHMMCATTGDDRDIVRIQRLREVP